MPYELKFYADRPARPWCIEISGRMVFSFEVQDAEAAVETVDRLNGEDDEALAA